MTAADYISYIDELYDRLLPDGLSTYTIEDQTKEILADIPKRIIPPRSTLDAGDRSYIVGAYDIGIACVDYEMYGEYYDSPKAFDGYVTRIGGSLGSGAVVTDANDAIVASASMGVVFNGTEYMIGEPDDGNIVDGIFIENNTIFKNGFYTIDDEYPFRFNTNYRPKYTGTGADACINGYMHIDGEVIDMTSVSLRYTDNDRQLQCALPASFCTEHSIHAGTVAILKYAIAETALDGETYMPQVFDIDRHIGIPNRVSPYITHKKTRGMYTQRLIPTPAEWATATEYHVGSGLTEPSYILYEGTIYKCRMPHTSSLEFGTDNANGYWSKVGLDGSAYVYTLYDDYEITHTVYNDTDMVYLPTIKEPIIAGGTPDRLGAATLGTDSRYVDVIDMVGPFSDFYWGVLREGVGQRCCHEALPVSRNGINYTAYRTDVDYVRGSLVIVDRDSGKRLHNTLWSEYDIDTADSPVHDKTVFYVRSDVVFYTSDTYVSPYELYYIPLDRNHLSLTTGSAIARHNTTQCVDMVDASIITLNAPAHIDWSIINSGDFINVGGVFSLKNHYSITYEPIMVYVDGEKAADATDYLTGTGVFTPNTLGIEFYYDGISRLQFNRKITGSVIVYSYGAYNSMVPFIKLYRSDYASLDATPVIPDYTLHVMAQRF